MRRVVLVLAGCAFAHHWQVRSERIPGGYRRALAKANYSRPHVVPGVPDRLTALAKLLVGFKNPIAGWQAGGHCCSFGRSSRRPAALQFCPPSSEECALLIRRSRPALCAEGTAIPNMEVRWIDINTTECDSEPSEGATTIPVFPLGSVYLPYMSATFTIFEPRYRQLFNDILLSGARRYAVCSVNAEGQLSEVGAILYLDDLKEISEQTQDQLKYIGYHTVIGRVKVRKLLNPSSVETLETYLRAEVEVLEDSDADEDTSAAEAELKQMFQELVDMQAQLGEEPRFTQAAKCVASFNRGTGKADKGLWGTLTLWARFLAERMSVAKTDMRREVSNELTSFFKNDVESLKNISLSNSDGLQLDELPEALAQRIRSIRQQYRENLDTMQSQQGMLEGPNDDAFVALLQCSLHAERLAIFRCFLNMEQKRLAARAAIKSIFDG